MAANRPFRAGQARALPLIPADGLTLAMDMDLNTVDLGAAFVAMVAFGGESRLGPSSQRPVRRPLEPRGLRDVRSERSG